MGTKVMGIAMGNTGATQVAFEKLAFVQMPSEGDAKQVYRIGDLAR